MDKKKKPQGHQRNYHFFLVQFNSKVYGAVTDSDDN